MKLKFYMQPLVLQFFRYVLVGGTAALVEWGSFFLFFYVVQIHYLLAVTGAFLLATGVNYVLSIKFVFSHGRFPVHKEAFFVYLLSAIGLILNLGLMWLFVGILSINPMFSKITSTGIVLIWNFTSRKVFIFRD